MKNPENLTSKQKLKLDDVLQYDLKSVRAYLLKESFQQLWYLSKPLLGGMVSKQMVHASDALQAGANQEIRPVHTKAPASYHELFQGQKQISSGVVEGMNRKVNLATRKAYGFKTFHALETALYHTMGDLPEPMVTHGFF